MSNIGDDWSDQQHEPTEDVDFDASGTTPPRPVKWDDTEAGPPPEPVQHQPPPSDHSGSNQQSNQQTSQQTPNDNSQGNIVHVSHMHVGVDDQLLTEHMSSSGKVIRVVIMLDPHTKESRGFGFVTFESASDADDAIEKLHLSQILGKTITVARARRGRPRDPTPGHYIGPPKYDRSMSSNGRPSKPRYQPYPSRDMGDSRDMRDARDARDYGYDRYERGPPRYAGRYHPYPDRDDRYGPLPPPRDYRDYSPPRDYYRGGPAPYRPYPRDGPPPSRREPPRDRFDDRPPRDSFARGPPRDYARDYPPRDDFDRPPRRFAPRGDFRDGYRDDMRGGPPRDYDRGYSRY